LVTHSPISIRGSLCSSFFQIRPVDSLPTLCDGIEKRKKRRKKKEAMLHTATDRFRGPKRELDFARALNRLMLIAKDLEDNFQNSPF